MLFIFEKFPYNFKLFQNIENYSTLERKIERLIVYNITVMLNEQQAMKVIQNAKVVTVQDLARQTGVKISAANAFLKQSVAKGTVKKVGGYAGHHLYQVVSS